MNEIERIIALSNAFGPSGFEEEPAQIVMDELCEYECHKDHMNNVICQKESGAADVPNVMLDAHLDEVGVIVQAVKPNGTMRFLPLGGWQKSSFPSSSFLLRDLNGGKHRSVVAVKPPHFVSAKEADHMPEVNEMILDVGTSSKSETEDLCLGIASPGVPDVSCIYDEERGLFYGKAFDCRIGVAAQIEVMKRLKEADLPCHLSASFSAQEEVGERGVQANARALHPDVMICFEGCPADDTFQEDYMIQSALKKGPMLRHMDVSMITNPRFQRFALDTAHENNIPVQESVRQGGGTNGAMVNQTFGVPAIVIGIPVRYIHSSHCWCALEDYENAVKLAVEIIKKLDNKAVKRL